MLTGARSNWCERGGVGVVKWMFSEGAAGKKPADIAEAANASVTDQSICSTAHGEQARR